MNSKIMASAASALGLCIAAPVAAQDVRGIYVELDAGIATVSDVNLTYFDDGGTFGGTGAEDSAEFRADLKSAFALGGRSDMISASCVRTFASIIHETISAASRCAMSTALRSR